MGSINTILQSNNTTRIARAQYRSNVARRDNTNKLEVAKGNFSEYMRSLRNKAQVDAASKEYNWKMGQLSEELRAAQGSNFNTQVQEAAMRGSLTAQAGAVGVGGSSVDLMDTMVRLQSEMDQETQDNAMKLMASRGAEQVGQLIVNAYKGMDMSRTFGQFDYSEFIEPKPMKRRFAALVGTAVATYFGGPMAGEAVASAFVGNWQASNGDFQGMSTSMGNVMSNAAGAMSDWDARGGKSWASSAFVYNDGTGRQPRNNVKPSNNSGGANTNKKSGSSSKGGFGWGW